LKLILNRDNSRAEIDEKEIKKALNYPIFWRLPNNYSSAIQAVNQGKPIVAVNHSSLASSYKKLSHELSGLSLPQKRRGLLGLFS
jgi:Flp pilus assembly CpaE family ATPase